MDNYTGKKVLILGLGLNQGGVGATKFFAKQNALVRVTDLKDEQVLEPSINQLKDFNNIEYILGEHRTSDIDWADLIIRNWGVKRENEFLKYAYKKGKAVETDMGIFLNYVNSKQIIGLTGSKGKSTIASLLYYAIKNQYPNAMLAGNIGKSVLDLVDHIKKDSLLILELSSFQLEAFNKHNISPHIAVITNIFPEHLNYYESYEDYTAAKKLIAKHQTGSDIFFINHSNGVINSPDFLAGINSQIIKFSEKDLPKDFSPKLPGGHNRINYAAALAVARHLGIDTTHALHKMNEFEGAEFRLQFVKESYGVKIYNDSAATNPDATIEALKTFPNSILICGGMNKGLDYSDLAEAIEKYTKAVYFLEGDATERIRQLESRIMDEKDRGTFNDLKILLSAVKKEAQKGDLILFSPGATSFNLFQNEFDRGRKFNQAVEEVFKERVSS
ncbi:UDP-N-acetylmuramoyl-L-alanine--D-glutamate ligase [Candidatus Daviesbacteria bacterium]|nr:UDP-N-acetylmuramoyl-L-alanine--D-glutamate ligase [Candidatus Daviesbacteria bacterium]